MGGEEDVLAWLGEWLQSIVVIVLLAIVVELVLPSSKMLRYSRLVVGLILLLTILNPVLQVFQVDFQEKLNASFSLWEKQVKSGGQSMSSLQQITQEAERLKGLREGAALDITQRSLEQAMLEELKRSTSTAISNVNVQLSWSEVNNKQSLPYIDNVTVTVSEQQETNSGKDIEVIAPIEIAEVSIPLIQSNEGERLSQAQQQQDSSSDNTQGEAASRNPQWSEQFHKQAQEIVTIIASGWNVHRDHIFVQASSS